MPRVLGNSYIHLRGMDAIVEYEEELLEMPPPLMNETAHQIGKQVAKLIEDGSTIRAALRAIVVHSGPGGSGHYTAYTKFRASGDWWHCDGKQHDLAKRAEAVNAQGYLLLYKVVV